jgi:hypothetical protein
MCRLLDYRSYVRVTQTLISDLNMLPVLFRYKKNVLEKYKAYYAELSLSLEQLDVARREALYLDLLREMGNVVGYKNLDNNLLNSRYLPNAAMDEHEYQMKFRERILAYLQSGNELHDLLIQERKMPPPKDESDKV